MNQVNFLPASYLQQSFKRKRIIAEAAIVAITALLLVIWAVRIQSGAATLAQRASQIEQKLPAAESAVEELAVTKATHQQLKQQLRMQKELLHSINQTQILATMSQLVPSSVAIMELRVDVNGRPPEPYRTQAELKKLESKRKTKEPAPPPPSFVDIDITGFAAEENDLADFLAALSRHPVFTRVKVYYSRGVEINRLLGREFRMSVQIPLDRQYKPARMEVADAHGK